MTQLELKLLNEFDRCGLYRHADQKLRQIIAQSPQQNNSRYLENINTALPMAKDWGRLPQHSTTKFMSQLYPKLFSMLSKWNETFNSFARKFHIITKYSLIGGEIDFLKTPQQYDSIKELLRNIKNSPELSNEVDLFLKNFPQLYRDIQGANRMYLSSVGKSYIDWFINTRNIDEFKAITNQLKNARQLSIQLARSGNGYYDASKLFKMDPADIQKALNGMSANNKLESFRRPLTQFLAANGQDVTQLKTTQQLKDAFKALINSSPDAGKYKSFVEHLDELAVYADDVPNVLKNTGAALNATDDGIKAAKILSTKIPALVKWLGPLGVLLSLPAAYSWTNKIINNQVDWGDAGVRADFVQDLTSLASAVTFMIPGAQALSLSLAAISIGIMGGKAISNQIYKPNSSDQKILGDYKPQNSLEQGSYEHHQYLIKALLDQATPGQTTDFNNWMGAQNPQYDFRTIKLADLMAKIQEFAKQPQYAKLYSWYAFPNRDNQWMTVEFNQKLLNMKKLVQSRGAAVGDTAYNNLNDVLNYLKQQFPGRFDRYSDLKLLMKDYPEWFKNVPKNLKDFEMVQWFNSHPKSGEWAF